jgi:diguanylate cyclase (GGDEF)-like protein
MTKNKDKIIKILLRKIKRLEKLSLYDDLTKLFCRRKLEEDLKRYCELNKRHHVNFDVVLIDIDNFKKINDTKGHKFGDKVLKQTAQILQNNIRQTDKAYRLSGGADEFIIIFSHHNFSVKSMMKRIKDKLKKIKVYISYGYFPICKNVLKIIDKKMYEEKRKK